ncbi:hypothetical protein C8Q70DRAFT_50491 [Cubamyces menziesii]|nr:hypothetical protein C8Q70DRAFT_50491 [Cubamyces menziesii]
MTPPACVLRSKLNTCSSMWLFLIQSTTTVATMQDICGAVRTDILSQLPPRPPIYRALHAKLCIFQASWRVRYATNSATRCAANYRQQRWGIRNSVPRLCRALWMTGKGFKAARPALFSCLFAPSR